MSHFKIVTFSMQILNNCFFVVFVFMFFFHLWCLVTRSFRFFCFFTGAVFSGVFLWCTGYRLIYVLINTFRWFLLLFSVCETSVVFFVFLRSFPSIHVLFQKIFIFWCIMFGWTCDVILLDVPFVTGLTSNILHLFTLIMDQTAAVVFLVFGLTCHWTITMLGDPVSGLLFCSGNCPTDHRWWCCFSFYKKRSASLSLWQVVMLLFSGQALDNSTQLA